MDKVKAFIKERDEVLLSGDLDRVIAFHQKHNPGQPFRTREVAEIAMHKARTAAVTLPLEAREASKRWLLERGYKSWD